MEVIMSLPVQEGSVIENDKGPDSDKLSKSMKKRNSLIMKIKNLEARKAKLVEELELFDKQEDIASGLGKAAGVDKKTPVSSSVATTGDKKSSISGKEIEKVNGVVDLNKSQKKKLKASVESLDKGEDTENTKSKAELSFNIISPSSLQNNDNPYGGISNTATVDKNNTVSSSSATGDEKSSVSKVEAPSDEMGSIMIKNLNVQVKTQNKMETAVDEIGAGTIATDKRKRPKKKNNPELGDLLSSCKNTQDITATVDQNNKVLSSSAIEDEKSSISKIEAPTGKTGSSMVKSPNAEVKTVNKMETAVGETVSGTIATEKSASKKRKRLKKTNNPESGDLLRSCKNTQDITATVDQNNKVPSSSAIGDEKSSISKIEDPTGKTGSSMVTSLNEEVKPLNKVETAVGETVSGTIATENTASKKRKRLKKTNNPESFDLLRSCKNIQDITATADQNNRVPSSSVIGDEKSSISKIEAPTGKTGSSMVTSLNAEVKPLNKMETAVGETGSGANTVLKKRKSPRKKKKNTESGDILSSCKNTQDIAVTVDQKNSVSSSSAIGDEKISISKIQAPSGTPDLSKVTSLNVEVKTLNKMETAAGETGSGTKASDNTVLEKRKRPKKKKSNPESGDILSSKNSQDIAVTLDQNNRVSSSSAIGDEKISISKIEFPSGKPGSSMVTSLNAEVKTLNKMETIVGEMGSCTKATDKTASKKRERLKKKKNNPESGDIVITRENTQDKTSTFDQNNRVSSLSTSGDEKSSISKIEAFSAKTGSSMVTSLNPEVKTQMKMETAVGETCSRTNATDNTVSKKRKRRKGKNKSPESGDGLSSHENTLDKMVTLEANMVSKGEANTKLANDNIGSNAITSINLNDTINPDKKPESKDESLALCRISNPGHTQVANDDKVSCKNSETTHELGKRNWKELETEKLASGAYLSTSESTVIEKKDRSPVKVGETMNVAVEKKKKPKMRKLKTTLGEILNPRNSEPLEAGISIEDMENNKRPRLNKNLASSGVLSTSERMQNTNKPLVASSTELEREDLPKTANGEKGPSPIVDVESTALKVIACTEVANIAEPAKLETAEAKANTTLPITMVKRNTEVRVNSQVASLGKKLVIFDVNGLLADIVSHSSLRAMADYRLPKRAIFKRPFLDDFLSFCFERFHVGIWSSRTMRILDPVVNFLLGDLKKKLLFIWDGTQCTNSWKKTLEDKYKFLVVKDLRKIWENDGPRKAWVKGDFNESNTLLLDDSPYKALVNPKHSGIFPVSYSYKDKDDDNLLAPKGELQNYLEGWAASDNVKTYVEQHPFGQGVIDESHPNWTFYARVLKGLSR